MGSLAALALGTWLRLSICFNAPKTLKRIRVFRNISEIYKRIILKIIDNNISVGMILYKLKNN